MKEQCCHVFPLPHSRSGYSVPPECIPRKSPRAIALELSRNWQVPFSFFKNHFVKEDPEASPLLSKEALSYQQWCKTPRVLIWGGQLKMLASKTCLCTKFPHFRRNYFVFNRTSQTEHPSGANHKTQFKILTQPWKVWLKWTDFSTLKGRGAWETKRERGSGWAEPEEVGKTGNPEGRRRGREEYRDRRVCPEVIYRDGEEGRSQLPQLCEWQQLLS